MENIRQQIFREYAESMNPLVISTVDGSEKPLMNVKDTHIVNVQDAHSLEWVLVSGSPYTLKKYLKTIEGKHKHGKPHTVKKHIKNLYS